MTYVEAHDRIAHPARGRLLVQARDDNPDLGQRDAARATLLRLAEEGAWSPPPPSPTPTPTPEDVALRAFVARHGGCCGGGVTA